MAQRMEDKATRYYDFHSTEDDLMGEPSGHSMLVDYLTDVLRWLFHEQRCAVYRNLGFYHTANLHEHPFDPDIALIKGVDFQLIHNWCVDKMGPVPQVVFEIAAEETWKRDREQGPLKCAQMGVEEYFVYDPSEPPLSGDDSRRLYGWRLDKAERVMRELPTRADGSIRSLQLESLLVPEGVYLRLYGHSGPSRLTRLEAALQRAEVLAEKLRSLGIDPDQL